MPLDANLPAHTSPRIICPPFHSAGGNLLVQRQQAADSLRMGGHLGLHLCWLWLELGFRELPVASALAAASVASSALAAASVASSALAAASFACSAEPAALAAASVASSAVAAAEPAAIATTTIAVAARSSQRDRACQGNHFGAAGRGNR